MPVNPSLNSTGSTEALRIAWGSEVRMQRRRTHKVRNALFAKNRYVCIIHTFIETTVEDTTSKYGVNTCRNSDCSHPNSELIRFKLEVWST